MWSLHISFAALDPYSAEGATQGLFEEFILLLRYYAEKLSVEIVFSPEKPHITQD